MKYESAKTPNGNVGISYESRELADEQARELDELGCYNCYNCYNCNNCKDCKDCYNCYNCENCYNCNHCYNCYNCNDCNDCKNCEDCKNCKNCEDCNDCENCKGVLKWTGKAASNLLAINGLIWPIAVSETHIQIGYQNHSHESWENFSDEVISRMDPRALEFWKTHKEFIMAAAKYKKGISS